MLAGQEQRRPMSEHEDEHDGALDGDCSVLTYKREISKMVKYLNPKRRE